jgi:hypothetical protein
MKLIIYETRTTGYNTGSCCTTQKKRDKGVENKTGMC